MWIHVTERSRIVCIYRSETHLGTSCLQTNSVAMLLTLEAYLGTLRSGLMRVWNVQLILSSRKVTKCKRNNSTIHTWKKNSSFNIKDKQSCRLIMSPSLLKPQWRNWRSTREPGSVFVPTNCICKIRSEMPFLVAFRLKRFAKMETQRVVWET